MGFKFNIIITLSVTTLVWMPSRNTKDIFCIFITQFQKRIWQIYISVLGNIEFVFVFFNHLTEFHSLCLLGILTWKKKKSGTLKKSPVLTKSTNMDIWVVGTSNRLFSKTEVVTGKTPFFVKGPFCTRQFICLNSGF